MDLDPFVRLAFFIRPFGDAAHKVRDVFRSTPNLNQYVIEKGGSSCNGIVVRKQDGP